MTDITEEEPSGFEDQKREGAPDDYIAQVMAELADDPSSVYGGKVVDADA